MPYDNYPETPNYSIYMLERGLRNLSGSAAEYLSVPQAGVLERVDCTIGDTTDGDVDIDIEIDGGSSVGTHTIPSGSAEGYSFTIQLGLAVTNYIKIIPTPGTNTVAAKLSAVFSIKR